jgi:DeoR/GlpR family transcriptional regulator of sugar metabolism
MNYKERYTQIAELIQTRKRVLVSELASHFNVSEVTIRKDLSHLEEMGICRRFHSGAISTAETGIFDIPVKHKITLAMQLKHRIAKAAVKMIRPDSTIFIDAGSTAHLVSYYLKGQKNLQVVTNSLMVGSELADETGIEVVMTGGNVRPVSLALVGTIALETIRKVHVDIAFIGAMGVSQERGFTSSTLAEAQCKEAMLSRAQRKVIIADHTKLEEISFATFATLSEVDMLITDDEAESSIIDKYVQTGLDVHIATE